MGKVYSNCFCMIAAASSEDCHGGLFQDSQPYSVLRDRMAGNSTKSPGLLLKTRGPPWPSRLLNSPLHRRGWTLQERELSPRILYFLNNSLDFECREARGDGQFSLSGPSDHYGLIPKDDGRVFYSYERCMDPILSKDGGVLWMESTPVMPETRYNTWLEMVEGYSKRKLSVPSDKFPAISGLAAEYSYMLKDEYVAGLWRNDLIRGLCWSNRLTLRPSPVSEYGPSWSWAKVDGEVSYKMLSGGPPDWERYRSIYPYHGESGDLPHVLEVATFPHGTDPNGTLACASIKMRAKVAPFRYRPGKSSWFLGSERPDIISWDLEPTLSKSYYLLSLGKAQTLLIITRSEGGQEGGKDLYIRVGIVRIWERSPASFFSDFTIEEITLI